jgi:transposase
LPAALRSIAGFAVIDLRWSFDRLAGIVEERIGRQARSGALFIFFGRHRAALKVLFFDGSGMCVFYKRLDAGTFRLPEPLGASAKTVKIDERALEALLDGIDVDRPALKRPRSSVH